MYLKLVPLDSSQSTEFNGTGYKLNWVLYRTVIGILSPKSTPCSRGEKKYYQVPFRNFFCRFTSLKPLVYCTSGLRSQLVAKWKIWLITVRVHFPIFSQRFEKKLVRSGIRTHGNAVKSSLTNHRTMRTWLPSLFYFINIKIWIHVRQEW